MLEYDGLAWHEDCFMCHGCDKPIGAEAFIPDKNNYYCVPCYEGRFAPQCSHCRKVNQASRTPRCKTFNILSLFITHVSVLILNTEQTVISCQLHQTVGTVSLQTVCLRPAGSD